MKKIHWLYIAAFCIGLIIGLDFIFWGEGR